MDVPPGTPILLDTVSVEQPLVKESNAIQMRREYIYVQDTV